MAVIAIDGRKYFDFGIGTYIQQLVKSLSSLKSPHRFILYASPEDVPKISLPHGWTIAEARYRKYSLGEIGFFGYRAIRDGVDVFHEPHYTLPMGIRDRSIVTIHDIIHLRFPELFSRFQRTYSYVMIRHSLRNSRFIITDSEFTKRDILASFRLHEDKIRVIPLGVGDQYRQLNKGQWFDEFKKRFGLQRPFILYVGNVKPHKGIGTLLNACKQLLISQDFDLGMVGGSIAQDPTLARLVRELGISNHIKELGRLSDEDMVKAYNTAEVLVMPSLYEGFGLPALEAMACGTPVVVSNAASLPEVVGDGAAVFHAGNSPELADVMWRVLRESTFRKDLIRKGKKRAKKFVWSETAAETMALYEKVLYE